MGRKPKDHGLSDQHLSIIKQVIFPYSERIKIVGLFRSRATGTYRHNSDIDTVIYGDITEADEALVLSKAWQLAVILLRVYRGLDAYMGGHKENVKLWLVAKNDALGGVPVELMGTVEGLVGVVQYLDAMRGP